jgi:hypothetical protein
MVMHIVDCRIMLAKGAITTLAFRELTSERDKSIPESILA